jgi:hypothetical protein
MNLGQTVRLKKWRHWNILSKGESGLVHVDIAMKPNLVGVFLFIGVENADGSGEIVDPDTFLKAMGWTPPADGVK